MKWFVLVSLISTSFATADEAFFSSKVLPILQKRCLECHSHATKIKGGLVLDSKSGWQKGGEHGPSVIPGKVDDSRLIKAIRYGDPDFEMPPKGKLEPEEIAVLEKWVADGAIDPRADPSVAKRGRVIDVEEGRKFWAFQPVRDTQAPAIKDHSWPRTTADNFILASLEKAGLTPSPDADAHTWLRRVSFDLTGLPPSPGLIDDFISGHLSRERVVDRLLQSKAFGERWARHWLDLTGYADQIGTSNNVFAEHAWRYRDYVIRTLNDDKPFDQFIREQIAGDLLATQTQNADLKAQMITATGFLVLGDVEIVAVDKLRMEYDLVDQQVSKIGTAFLGMTLGCVRCHDHKFDPIAQQDYYAIAGMFRSTDSTYKTDNGVWSSVNKTELPETPAEKAHRDSLLAKNEASIQARTADRQQAEKDKASVEAELKTTATESKAALEKKRDELAAKVKKLNSEIEHAKFFAPVVPKAFAVHDREHPEDMRLTIRGNPYALGDRMKRGALRVASWEAFPPIPATQSGRMELANWVADTRNPLTPRVTVNRIWQKLFGEGLVRSVDYFGTRGEKPTHPELLDHLAAKFMRERWSMKHLIRDLVLSRTYAQTSLETGEAAARARQLDPDNRLLWHMNRQRLDAEAIRDAMLAVSGTLATSSGGPALPLEYLENVTSLSPKAVNPPAFSLKKFRPIQDFERTVYLPVIRSAGQPGSAKLRDVFDFAQPAQITGQRPTTAVPTQSLFLLNSDLIRGRATDLATMLLQHHADERLRLDALWLRVLNRPISDAEHDDAAAYLHTLPTDKAWTELCHALLSSNEFLLRL